MDYLDELEKALKQQKKILLGMQAKVGATTSPSKTPSPTPKSSFKMRSPVNTREMGSKTDNYARSNAPGKKADPVKSLEQQKNLPEIDKVTLKDKIKQAKNTVKMAKGEGMDETVKFHPNGQWSLEKQEKPEQSFHMHTWDQTKGAGSRVSSSPQTKSSLMSDKTYARSDGTPHKDWESFLGYHRKKGHTPVLAKSEDLDKAGPSTSPAYSGQDPKGEFYFGLHHLSPGGYIPGDKSSEQTAYDHRDHVAQYNKDNNTSHPGLTHEMIKDHPDFKHLYSEDFSKMHDNFRKAGYQIKSIKNWEYKK